MCDYLRTYYSVSQVVRDYLPAYCTLPQPRRDPAALRGGPTLPACTDAARRHRRLRAGRPRAATVLAGGRLPLVAVRAASSE